MLVLVLMGNDGYAKALRSKETHKSQDFTSRIILSSSASGALHPEALFPPGPNALPSDGNAGCTPWVGGLHRKAPAPAPLRTFSLTASLTPLLSDAPSIAACAPAAWLCSWHGDLLQPKASPRWEHTPPLNPCEQLRASSCVLASTCSNFSYRSTSLFVQPAGRMDRWMGPALWAAP